MKNNHLIKILRTFSGKEIVKFGEFLNSPFYNKKPNALKFYEVLKQHAPRFRDEAISKLLVWEELYPGKKFNPGVFKNLVFELTSLAEKFIEVQNYESSNVEKKLNHLNALSKRKLHGKFYLEAEAVLRMIGKSGFYQEYFFDKQRLNLLKLGHSADHTNYESKISDEMLAVSDYYLSDMIVRLSDYYNRINNYLIGQNKLPGKSFSGLIFENIDVNEIIESSGILSESERNILRIYYYKYLSFVAPENADNYYSFRNSLYEHSSLFSREEKFALYIHLGDALNIRPSGKDDNKIAEFLELYKKRIDENVFIDPDGKLNIYSYTNIVKMAGMMADHKLIKFASENFSGLLMPEFSENMRFYTDAYFCYSTGKFEKALEHSQKIRLDHFAFKFDIKDLQIMIHYELGDAESFMYNLDSYRHFLKNNRSVSEYYRKMYGKFISGVHRLFRIKMKFDEFELSKIEKDVQSGKTGSKYWFNKKILELRTAKRN